MLRNSNEESTIKKTLSRSNHPDGQSRRGERKMKIELALSAIEERVWKGLTLIDGELFTVSIFPGSATTDWDAEVAPMTYVECTPGNKMTEAIERAFKMWEIRGRVPEEDFRVMIEVINEHPEMLEEIRQALKK
jgi:hypothetical protein